MRQITKAQFARLVGVSGAAVSASKLLAPALVGKRIDADHPAARSYAEKKGVDIDAALGVSHKSPHTRGRAAANESRKSAATGEADAVVPENIEAYADMTLREIISRYGTDTRFGDWLKALKAIEDIHEKRLKNATAQGKVVNRELVKRGIIDPINAAHMQLLSDGSKTISRQMVAMVKAGRSQRECEDYIRDQMTSFIRPLKAKLARNLRNA